MKNDETIISSLKKLRDIGISNFELAYVKWDDHIISLIEETCKELSIKVGSSQINLKTIEKNYDEIVKYHHSLGCKYLSVSILSTKYILKAEKGIRQYAKRIDVLGKKLSREGIHLLHHHHHMEYANFGNKKGIDLIMASTDARYVNLVLDTYWTQVGGANPIDILNQYGDRIKVIHIRDVVSKLNIWKRDFETKDCALGTGNMDIFAIVRKANEVNVPYLIIEQDTKQPFKDIETSFRYLETYQCPKSL